MGNSLPKSCSPPATWKSTGRKSSMAPLQATLTPLPFNAVPAGDKLPRKAHLHTTSSPDDTDPSSLIVVFLAEINHPKCTLCSGPRYCSSPPARWSCHILAASVTWATRAGCGMWRRAVEAPGRTCATRSHYHTQASGWRDHNT